MEELRKSLSEFWSIWAPTLQSDMAVFFYCWGGILSLLLMSAFAAKRLLAILDAFSEENLLRNFKGRKPQAPEAIERRIAELRRYSTSILALLTWRTVGLLFVGFVIPGGLLGLIATYQDFLLPGEPALMWPGETATRAHPTTADVALFVVDQAMRGGLSDAFEVFGIALTALTNNADNAFFSAFVLAYRFLTGIVAATILYVIYRIAKGIAPLNEAIKRLQAAHAASIHTSDTNTEPA
ncbi:MAG: hypothetical protein RLN89_10115 [Parvibaculum sp.]